MKTERQRRGAAAEDEVANYLVSLGWRLLARNVRVGRDEIDILAVDPAPPVLVFVEVRSVRAFAFGAPEERVDRAKVGRLYRAMSSLGQTLEVDDPERELPRRVDLVVVDRRSRPTQLRHLKSLEPP